MGNLPKYRVVGGKFDRENKKWEKEYGAVWETVWSDGNKSISMRLQNELPVGEWAKLVPLDRRVFQKKTEEKPKQNTEKEDEKDLISFLDDDIPF